MGLSLPGHLLSRADVRYLVLVLLICVLLTENSLSEPRVVVDSFPTPASCPTGLAWDGRCLWVADRKSDSLYQIDPSDGRVRSLLPSPGFWPMGLAWDGASLWNVDLEDRELYQMDPRTGLVLRSISAPCPQPTGLAWDGQHLLLSDVHENQIYRVSPDDGTVVSSFPSPFSAPTGLSMDSKYLWVSDRGRDEIYMTTPQEGEVVVTFSSPGPYANDLAWDGEHLWNVDYQSDRIYKIELRKEQPYSTGESEETLVEYTQELRNYGPGEVVSVDFYLAIPEDSPHQQVRGTIEYDPPPDGFLNDRWGQRVGHWSFSALKPPSLVKAQMRMRVCLSAVNYHIFPEEVRSLREIPSEIKNAYLVDGTKYRIRDPSIRRAAKEAVGEERNPFWMARNVFKYVIDHVEYQRTGGWEAAPAVLKRGTGSCSEYTFLFIAMCRAIGLPARYVGGVTGASDDASWDRVFHRWAEVYLPGYGWVPVDPSGGDRKSPGARARAFGRLPEKYLVTTVGGGDSEYLGWTYNSHAAWTFKGRCKVHLEKIAEQEPRKQ